MNERDRRKNDNQCPFENETHPTDGKLQHTSAAKMKAPHPAVGNQKQIYLKASAEEVFEGK